MCAPINTVGKETKKPGNLSIESLEWPVLAMKLRIKMRSFRARRWMQQAERAVNMHSACMCHGACS